MRADLGYPPLVTPMSQMVGVQATVNVLLGERYKNIGKEIKAYIHGEYGKAPGEINPELIRKVLGDQPMVTGRYAETLEPEFSAAKAALGDLAESDLDVLSYIVFPQPAEQYFEERERRRALVTSYTIEEVR